MNVPKHILLVEDSRRDAELMLDALKGAQLAVEITHVRDGASALDYLHRRGAFAGRPDDQLGLVLMDLKMPRMSGHELLQAIRANPATRLLPVVVMTSSAEEQDIQRCYELGANAYVVKPLAFGDFVDAVQKVGVFWSRLNEAPTTRLSP